MVRINLVPVKNLSDEHAMAEYVEIGMCLKFAQKYPTGTISESYTLGKGHMSYFRNKVGYLQRRQKQLMINLLERGYNMDVNKYKEYQSMKFPPQQQQPVKVTQEQIKENVDRISSRLRKPLKKTTKYKYYGVPKTATELILLLPRTEV